LSGSQSILRADNQGYWILQNNSDPLSRVFYSASLKEPSAAFQAFPVLQNLGVVIDMAFADSVLVLTGKDRVSLFDLRNLKQLPGLLSLSFSESGSAAGGKMFHFSGMELQQLPKPWFRYRVLPDPVSWSPWSPSRECSLSGLKHGSYTLEVQAMDLYGRITDAEPMLFTVPPPWYAAWYAYVIYVILLLMALFLIQKWRLLNYRRAESRIAQRMELKIQNLAAEKEKSEKLVTEMLPEETANQIRSHGKAKWDKYERATVLFSDIQGFTKIAEEMNPEKLIDELDQFFFHFDSVVEKYNIEKIKTIGDAYMAAGGIPNRNSTNPVEVVLAAIEMQTYMQQLKSTRANIWDLRIGIHTGPVIAGVVGHKKMSYDIWGDTVNTASRMESSGTAGKINISGITYSMVKDYFICEYRGKLPVKYKGNIDMYYVTGLRPELSVDLKGIPNKRFFIKLQILRLGDLEEKVFGDILRSLPESLHFHNLEYARKVYNQSFLLCRSEEIEEEDRLLVRTAALMLYTGLTQDYHNFQNRSAVICREILPGYKYSDRQIDQICNLVLATKTPSNPETQLEKIMVDAKMEYIGRPDYPDRLNLLFQELKETGSKINGQQFKNQQLELLYEFQFYTVAGKRLREVSGQKQMNNLEKERWI
jgi:class 3 adenylate cyclase